MHLHLDQAGQAGLVFFDETQHVPAEPDDASADVREREANAFAQEMLIAADVWERKQPLLLPDPSERAVRNVAQELRISPAILAGRIRWETQDYTQLGSLVGARQVREQFEEYKVGGVNKEQGAYQDRINRIFPSYPVNLVNPVKKDAMQARRLADSLIR